MRRHVIRFLLPVVFCLLPPLAAALIAASMPPSARDFYLDKHSPLDGLMLALGLTLFVFQIALCWQALQWSGTRFNVWPDALADQPRPGGRVVPAARPHRHRGRHHADLRHLRQHQRRRHPAEIIFKYAPAITATCTGLFMALINILPTWIVLHRPGPHRQPRRRGPEPNALPVADPSQISGADNAARPQRRRRAPVTSPESGPCSKCRNAV